MIEKTRRTKYKCQVCGILTNGKLPINPKNHKERGDGTFRYPEKHKDENGDICPGTYQEAIWVDVEIYVLVKK